MLLIRLPIQLMLQPKKTQAKKEMTMMRKASVVLLAWRSPKPMVRMMVVPKQQLQMYCSCHGNSPIPLALIQFSSCSCATTIRAHARRWQTNRFFKITPNSRQYLRSWEALIKRSSSLCTCSIKFDAPIHGPTNKISPNYTPKLLRPTETTPNPRAHNYSARLIFLRLRKASAFSWLRLVSASHFFCMVSRRSQRLKKRQAHLRMKRVGATATSWQRRASGKRKQQSATQMSLRRQSRLTALVLSRSDSLSISHEPSSANSSQKGLQATGFRNRLFQLAFSQNIFTISLVFSRRCSYTRSLPRYAYRYSSFHPTRRNSFPQISICEACSCRQCMPSRGLVLLRVVVRPSTFISIPDSLSSLWEQKSAIDSTLGTDLQGTGPIFRSRATFSILSLQVMSIITQITPRNSISYQPYHLQR